MACSHPAAVTTRDGSTQAMTSKHTLATADDAQKNLTRRQRDRDRETRQGAHYELVDRETWRRTARHCFLDSCSHTSEKAS